MPGFPLFPARPSFFTIREQRGYTTAMAVMHPFAGDPRAFEAQGGEPPLPRSPGKATFLSRGVIRLRHFCGSFFSRPRTRKGYFPHDCGRLGQWHAYCLKGYKRQAGGAPKQGRGDGNEKAFATKSRTPACRVRPPPPVTPGHGRIGGTGLPLETFLGGPCRTVPVR